MVLRNSYTNNMMNKEVVFMSEAIVDFIEVSNKLAPAFKDRLVRVIWDEY